jgi:hypothetical protein
MMNPYVRDVIAAEFRFTHLFADVQRIIGEAVGIRYADPRDTETEETNSAPEPGAAGPDAASADSQSPGATESGASGSAESAQSEEAGADGSRSSSDNGDDDLKGPRRIIVPGRDI